MSTQGPFGKYKTAMLKVSCDHANCLAPIGQTCKGTSSVVHAVRRAKAIAEGHWDPDKAFLGDYGDLAGEPLEALKSAKRKW